MPEKAKTTFENINDLLKAVLWPLIAFVVFFTYKSEFNQIFQVLPKKLESSSKISVGSLSFEIEKTAKESGNGELAEIIKNLSEKGIRKLLTLGSGRHSVMIRNDQNRFNNEKSFTLPRDYDVLQELEKKGLLKANEPLDKFLSFFKSLKPTETERYYSASGGMRGWEDSTYNEKVIDLTLPVSRMSTEESTRVESFGVELSESGKKAFDIIVHVISEQINKE